MTYSFLVPPVPEADEWINPETVRDERAGADAESRVVPLRHTGGDRSAPPRSDTGDTLQDVLVDVWEDAGKPLDCYRTWWTGQLRYWSDHAQYKLRRGKDSHLHAHQGSDIVAKVFERMAGSDTLPPRRWGAFRMYMYTAIDNMCQDLGDLVRVTTCSAPWEMYPDSHRSPADTHPDADPHTRQDARVLGDLVREHTTDKERELLLFLWGGHIADSIAENTGGKREAVKKRITRLRSRLKLVLAQHGYGWKPRERGDRVRRAAEGNVDGVNRDNVPEYPSFPLYKVERVTLPRVDRVPTYSGDTHVVTDAPVTVRRIRALTCHGLLVAA